jgi:hypothetical protein
MYGPIIHISIAENFQAIPVRMNIGMTMLEDNRIPRHWLEKCNQMDQVCVPSSFLLRNLVKVRFNLA